MYLQASLYRRKLTKKVRLTQGGTRCLTEWTLSRCHFSPIFLDFSIIYYCIERFWRTWPAVAALVQRMFPLFSGPESQHKMRAPLCSLGRSGRACNESVIKWSTPNGSKLLLSYENKEQWVGGKSSVWHMGELWNEMYLCIVLYRAPIVNMHFNHKARCRKCSYKHTLTKPGTTRETWGAGVERDTGGGSQDGSSSCQLYHHSHPTGSAGGESTSDSCTQTFHACTCM